MRFKFKKSWDIVYGLKLIIGAVQLPVPVNNSFDSGAVAGRVTGFGAGMVEM